MQLQQIAERCQQGDREAFSQLYTVMRQPLRTVCLRYVANEAVADDLLHDAFLLIITKIGELKDTTRVEAWMTMVMRRVALLYLRQQKPQLHVPLAEAAYVAAPASADGFMLSEILAAVDTLPEGYRRVFRLSVLEGMTHQEIAALLHIEPHSSSSQLFHAKALLRRWLCPLMLLLLALALPLGVNYRKDSKTKVSERTQVKVPVLQQRPTEPSPLAISRKQKTDIVQTADTIETTKEESVIPPVETYTPESEALSKQSEQVRAEKPTERIIAERIASENGTKWTLVIAYSGLSNNSDMALPYADRDTNPMVYDSVAHHHIPLTVGLMLNRKLGLHWQVGVGLQYQRMTSDMLSGNTYISLSQHQLVQRLAIPVSVSWHYPLWSRFSTYLSASASVGLPLRSTLESAYLMDGHTYDPTTVRLHPGVAWSTAVGIGLQYNLTPHLGFFAEPSLHYHFQDGDNAVKTWNTEHPVTFSLPLGLRVTF